jgi:hypothetical protein
MTQYTGLGEGLPTWEEACDATCNVPDEEWPAKEPFDYLRSHAEREIERLRGLVEKAHREGFEDGHESMGRLRDGAMGDDADTAWACSHVRAALNQEEKV